ncbi:MAG: hypothetical protein MZV63_14185, partial [Marinilabiliales bacterium]|nr:hypothetical protein [Marinilabiliales bacterium]
RSTPRVRRIGRTSRATGGISSSHRRGTAAGIRSGSRRNISTASERVAEDAAIILGQPLIHRLCFLEADSYLGKWGRTGMFFHDIFVTISRSPSS